MSKDEFKTQALALAEEIERLTAQAMKAPMFAKPAIIEQLAIKQGNLNRLIVENI